jgi:thiol-disulfide isomerase/thioredoxin
VIGRTRVRVAALVATAALAGALYLTVDGQGNGGSGSCAAARPRAEALDPFAAGEVAAFQVARAPLDVSDLAFRTPDGADVTLASYAGKVTLLNLWATWCAPCRREMPALDRLQQALGGEDFAVVPVSIDTGGPERPRAFLDSIGVENLPLNIDPTTEIFEELKGRGLALGLPVTVLVGRDGCHLGHMNGPAEWDSKDGQALIEAALATRRLT